MKKIILLGVFLGVSACGQKENSTEVESNTTHKTEILRKDEHSEQLDQATVQKEGSKWVYEESNDEMRGVKTKFAFIDSDNQVNFNSPYDGGSYLRTIIRQKANGPMEVIFTISKGQYSCDTISNNCFASLKFDNKEIQEIQLDGTTDYSSDVLFIKSSKDSEKFIRDITKANSLIVELPFYQEGNKQFKFSSDDLKWETIQPPNIVKSLKANSTIDEEAIRAAAEANEVAEAVLEGK
jgi:hypothetical protein